jgi:hypothetical protein
MKKFISILIITSLMMSLITISISGCSNSVKNFSRGDAGYDKEVTKEMDSSVLPEGFPAVIPVYPGATVIKTEKDEVDGETKLLVIFECTGDIEEVSEWYSDVMNSQCDIGSVSSGDMGDWSEYYAEAEKDGIFFTVYIYQDEGSDSLTIDINTTGLLEGKSVAQTSKTEQDPDSQYIEESADQTFQGYSGELEDASIAFVCASVGSAWNIGEHFPALDIRVYDEYQFDKGHRIREILQTEKPDIMIVKECAAYFPPDSQGSSMSLYQNLVREWVGLCRDSGIIPVLTTVVPIDPDNPANSGRSQLDSILEFNDWIINYCSDEDISVLDLEEALRISSTDRSLNPAYDSGDGLHPNDIAYTEKLDHILIPALMKALETGQ